MLPAVSWSAPYPQVPGHGGIQGAEVSGVSVDRSVGQLLKEGKIPSVAREALSPPLQCLACKGKVSIL